MYCKYCGEIIDDDSVICFKCGKKVKNADNEATIKASNNASFKTPKTSGKSGHKTSKIKELTLFFIAVALLIIFSGFKDENLGTEQPSSTEQVNSAEDVDKSPYVVEVSDFTIPLPYYYEFDSVGKFVAYEGEVGVAMIMIESEKSKNDFHFASDDQIADKLNEVAQDAMPGSMFVRNFNIEKCPGVIYKVENRDAIGYLYLMADKQTSKLLLINLVCANTRGEHSYYDDYIGTINGIKRK